ncbi:nucleotide-binding protein [Phytohabitans houttuyneae]|uniref:nucleotide-binding protein n=1 Tax=Phytohabitans houttuyneae TaxID=1076126 RepID=UPI0015642D29|nr:hypothetical protein [Phytohabitans houttuyneae]
MTPSSDEPGKDKGRSIAILSGKGGSGKTLVAAVAASAFAAASWPNGSVGPVVLVDADAGTSGLSYYLGMKYVHNIGDGLAEVAADSLDGDSHVRDAWSSLRPLRDIELVTSTSQEEVLFLPMGDNALLMRTMNPQQLPPIIRDVVASIASRAGRLIVDCRGGIDDESLAVCEAVDDIVLVVEPDTTSVQATKHLSDVLSEKKLAHKLRGFIVNKAMENPTIVGRNGSGLFRTRYLSAVPFDLDANRAFLVGELPMATSLFVTHVVYGLSRLYPELPKPPRSTIWSPEDFDRLALLTPESARGGVISGMAIITLGIAFAVNTFAVGHLTASLTYGFFAFLALFGIIGSLEPTRRLLGRALAGSRRRTTRRIRRL